MQMSEGLLLRQDRDVILRGVFDDLADLVGSERSFLRSHKRLALEVEDVLHVKREEVNFVGGEEADLFLGVFEGRYGAAADVVVNAAPLHAWPVADGDNWALEG